MVKRETYVHTLSGKLNVFAPDPEDISIFDIANSLSNICRYGGNTKHFYSVAQHSCLVSKYCSDENKAWGLLHDASEAYIGDVVSPLKHCYEFQFYLDIETEIMEVICEKFNLPFEQPEEVKKYDMIVRSTEMRDLTNIPSELIDPDYPPLAGLPIYPLTPSAAKVQFLNEALLLNLK